MRQMSVGTAEGFGPALVGKECAGAKEGMSVRHEKYVYTH